MGYLACLHALLFNRGWFSLRLFLFNRVFVHKSEVCGITLANFYNYISSYCKDIENFCYITVWSSILNHSKSPLYKTMPLLFYKIFSKELCRYFFIVMTQVKKVLWLNSEAKYKTQIKNNHKNCSCFDKLCVK